MAEVALPASIREMVEDICMCQGPGERVLRGALVLFVCKRCGKVARERSVRAGDADLADLRARGEEV